MLPFVIAIGTVTVGIPALIGGYVYSNYLSTQRSWKAFTIGAVGSGIVVPTVGKFIFDVYTKLQIEKEKIHPMCKAFSRLDAYNVFVEINGETLEPSAIAMVLDENSKDGEILVQNWKKQAKCY